MFKMFIGIPVSKHGLKIINKIIIIYMYILYYIIVDLLKLSITF